MNGSGRPPAAGDGPAGGSHAGSEAPETLEALRRRVVAAVRRTCPSRLAGQAEDIVQTVLVQLLAAGKVGEGRRTLSSTYLLRAAYGTAVDEIRRLSRRREDPEGGMEELDRRASPSAGPDRETSSAEIARGIQDCLRGIVRSRRLAVTLYLEGCRVREAAELLGWSVKKTENLVYRGLDDLRVCLRGKGLEP